MDTNRTTVAYFNGISPAIMTISIDVLKAPITSPQDGSYQSLNSAIRKKPGLFSNIRPMLCRFASQDKQSISFGDLLSLHLAIHPAGFKNIKTENLNYFDGRPDYSVSKGEK